MTRMQPLGFGIDFAGILILIISGMLYGRWVMKKRKIWNRRSGSIFYFAVLLIFGVGGFLMLQYEYHWLKIFRYFILMYGLLLLAFIDVREKVIPNQGILMLLGIRFLLMVGDVIAYPQVWLAILISFGAGMLGGGLLFFLPALFSKNAIGMGDVKMVAVMGFYLGFQVLMSDLAVTLTLTVMVGLILLLLNRKSFKSELPFAPFAAVGTIVTLLLGF